MRIRSACTSCRRGKHGQEDGLRSRPAATPAITTQGKVPMQWHTLPPGSLDELPIQAQGSGRHDGTTQNRLIPPSSQLSQPATRFSLSIRRNSDAAVSVDGGGHSSLSLAAIKLRLHPVSAGLAAPYVPSRRLPWTN